MIRTFQRSASVIRPPKMEGFRERLAVCPACSNDELDRLTCLRCNQLGYVWTHEAGSRGLLEGRPRAVQMAAGAAILAIAGAIYKLGAFFRWWP